MYALSLSTPNLGIDPNYDHAKHLSARSAHGLMQGLSERKITGTEGGRFRTVANLLYEAISGLPDADLKRSLQFRACDIRNREL